MSRRTVTYSIMPLWRGTTLLPISPVRNHTATNTRSCDAHNHPVNKYPWRSSVPRQGADCLAILPWYLKRPSLAKEDYNNYKWNRAYRKHFTICRRLCVRVGHSHSVARFSGQPHAQHSSGRKLLNSIINSPLTQLPFFLFHFRITISRSPRKSPDRLLMIRGRGELPSGLTWWTQTLI